MSPEAQPRHTQAEDGAPSGALQAGTAVPARRGEETPKMETALREPPPCPPCCPTFCPLCVSRPDHAHRTPHAFQSQQQSARQTPPSQAFHPSRWLGTPSGPQTQTGQPCFGLKGMDRRPPKADRSQVGPLNQGHLSSLNVAQMDFFFLMGARNSQCPPKNSNEEKQ